MTTPTLIYTLLLLYFQVNTDHCVTDLQQLLTDCGPHEKQLEEHLQQHTGLFFGHEVTGCPTVHVQSAKRNFIEKLVANINER